MKLCIIGSGGHGATVLANVLAGGFVSHWYEGIDFIDDAPKDEEVLGYPIVGTTALLNDGGFLDSHLFVVGIGNPQVRWQITARLINRMAKMFQSVHPSATICHGATLGEGTVVMPGAVVSAGVWVGRSCIVNNGASLGHYSVLRDGCSVNDGSRLGGSVTIGHCAYLGMNVSVIGPRVIGEHAVVGAGSVVTKDVAARDVVCGVPARSMRGKSDAADRPSDLPGPDRD